jgi:hypothetical protein
MRVRREAWDSLGGELLAAWNWGFVVSFAYSAFEQIASVVEN